MNKNNELKIFLKSPLNKNLIMAVYFQKLIKHRIDFIKN